MEVFERLWKDLEGSKRYVCDNNYMKIFILVPLLEEASTDRICFQKRR